MLAMLLLSMALFTLACGGTTSDGVYRTPIVERGVCATILMPGETMPMPEPGDSPGCPGGYTSIAGGGVVEESQKTTKTEPHPAVKVITAPFVVLLFPFKLVAAGADKLGDLVNPDDEVPMDPRLRRKQAQIAKADPQAAHEQQELSALERELEQRGGKTRSSSSSSAAAPRVGAGQREAAAARAAALLDRRRAGGAARRRRERGAEPAARGGGAPLPARRARAGARARRRPGRPRARSRRRRPARPLDPPLAGPRPRARSSTTTPTARRIAP